jgi:hypothetical protein
MGLHDLNSIKELSIQLGIQEADLHQSIASGQLHGIAAPKHSVINGVIRYKRGDVLFWIDALNDKNSEGM